MTLLFTSYVCDVCDPPKETKHVEEVTEPSINFDIVLPTEEEIDAYFNKIYNNPFLLPMPPFLPDDDYDGTD